MLEAKEEAADVESKVSSYRSDERASVVVLPMAYQMTLYSQRGYSGSGQQMLEIATVRSIILRSGFVSHCLTVSQQIPRTVQLSVQYPKNVAPWMKFISSFVNFEIVSLFKASFLFICFFIFNLASGHYTTNMDSIKTTQSSRGEIKIWENYLYVN